MKKLVIATFALLITWNTALTIELLNQKSKQGNSGNNSSYEEEVYYDINSELTELVAASENKVVGITAMIQQQGLGTGSGAIYANDNGLVKIVTNHHVVEGADELIVKFANGEEVAATLVGSDALTDLAVLELEVDFDVEAFKFGDSSNLKKGEDVIAMGSPLGLDFQGSVTDGIISGVDRVVGTDLNGDGIDDWDNIVIQTNAAINPGNSGGPLINMAGELIGINSSKIADTSVEGIGFAIPINEALPIIEALETDGEVVRPMIGISARSIADLTPFEQAYLEIDPAIENGLFIMQVTPNSSAAKAGIQENDVLIEFNGEEVVDFKQFRKELYDLEVGDKVSAKIYREGKISDVTITLE